MKTAEMKLGTEYAQTGHRDWDGDIYESATRVTLLDKRTWYDDSSGTYWRKAEVRTITPDFGGPVKVSTNIGTEKRSYCKRGVLVRVENGWSAGNVRVVAFQQIVSEWEAYAATVADNLERRKKMQAEGKVRAAEEKVQRERMMEWARELGIAVRTINMYGAPVLRLTYDDVAKLAGKE